jgi:hypothetical protein
MLSAIRRIIRTQTYQVQKNQGGRMQPARSYRTPVCFLFADQQDGTQMDLFENEARFPGFFASIDMKFDCEELGLFGRATDSPVTACCRRSAG